MVEIGSANLGHEMLPPHFEITRNLEKSQAVIVVPLSPQLEGFYWRWRDEKVAFPSGQADIANVGPHDAAVQEINYEAGYKGKNLFALCGLSTILDTRTPENLTMGVYATLFDGGTVLRPRKNDTTEILQFMPWAEMPGPEKFYREHYFAAQLVRGNLDEIVSILREEQMRMRRALHDRG